MKSIITILVTSMYMCIPGIGQKSWFDSPTPHSPNVSNLGKFGDIPVGHYTGAAQINVPIYNLINGNLEVPINLRYHSSGIRVSEISSWVGLGWALDVGGNISRSIRSTPDEGGYNGQESYNGYYRDYGPNMPLSYAPENWLQLDNIARSLHDIQPDLFFFKFGNYSGSFFFDEYRKPHLIPEQDLKIEVDYSTNEFNQFIITSPDGLKYYFGGVGINGVEAIDKEQGNIGENVNVSSWYLVKIENPDQSKVINLEYESEEYEYYTLAQFREIVREGYCEDPIDLSGYFSTCYFNGVRLSRISTPNIQVEFIPGTELRKDFNTNRNTAHLLDKIIVEDVNNTSITRIFNFKYHWETCGGEAIWSGENPDIYRPILDEFQETTNDATPPYKFSYFQLPSSSTTTDGPKLVRRLSYSQDHWGYFNNADNTRVKWLIPKITFPTFSCETFGTWGGANREPSWPAMRMGTLKSVIYPTGGSTEFDFESHNYLTNITDTIIALDSPIFGGYDDYSGIKVVTASYTFPVAQDGETYEITLKGYLKEQTSSSYCGEVILYDNSTNLSIGGFSLDCADFSKVVEKSISLTPGTTYNLRLELVNAYGELIVKKSTIGTHEGYKIVGGLRTKSITDYNGNSKKVGERDYSYQDAVLFKIPTYYREVTDNFNLEWGGIFVCSTGKKLYEVSSSEILPMMSVDGNNIGYGTVTESQPGNGKTIYTFQNNIDNVYINDYSLYYPTIPPPPVIGNGNLYTSKTYNEKGVLIREENNFYYTQINSNVNAPAYSLVKVFIPPDCRNNGISGSSGGWDSGWYTNAYNDFSFKTGYSRLISNTVHNIFNDIDLKTETTYEYSPNYINQVRSKNVTNSLGKIISINNLYPADIMPNYTYAPNFYNEYLENLHSCLSQYSSDAINYNSCFSTMKSKYITNILNYDTYFNTTINSDKSAGDNKIKAIYNMFSGNQILPIESFNLDISSNNKLLNAELFNFQSFLNSTTNVSEVKLQSVAVLPIKSAINDFTASKINSGIYENDSRYEVEQEVKYNNGKIVEISKENDIKTSYIWSYNNSFPVIKADNITYSTLESALTSIHINLDTYLISTIGNLTNNSQKDAWKSFNSTLRNLSSLSKGRIYTYTYSPIYGLTSETDPNGVTTYYEYDAFGRLKLIRDDEGNILKTYEYNYKQ